MLAQLKLPLPLPPLPRPLELPASGFTSSCFSSWEVDLAPAKSPDGTLWVGDKEWWGEETSGGFRAALLMLSRCLREGLVS